MNSNQEYVVLVDKQNNVLGTSPKLAAHNANTPLHRGFSVFLFNSDGELLLQQRSRKKKTWPLVWSNSVCGHPKLNESSINAAKRRAIFELGIELGELHEILPNFSYRVEKDEIVENEICPVLVGFTNQKPVINKDEIEDTKWIEWKTFVEDINKNPNKYSPWSVLEVQELLENRHFQSMLLHSSVL
ncbi:MAG: isopentenyl-diphosphate Delta-isomerase [Candidatus Levybacteria bacterium]|nr:isopentenyl-diphosphate Delta-isomerase [Candidatus Levybacteria bacterium]